MRTGLYVMVLLVCCSLATAVLITTEQVEDAGRNIDNARQALVEEGLSTFRVDDLAKEGKKQFDEGNFEGYLETAAEIVSLKEKAFMLRDSLRSRDYMIEKAQSLEMDVIPVLEEIQQARYEFELNNYEGVESRLAEIDALLGQEASRLAGKFLEEISQGSSQRASQMQEILKSVSESGDFEGLMAVYGDAENILASQKSLEKIEEVIGKFENEELPSTRIKDLLNEALVKFEAGNDEAVEVAAEASQAVLEMALNAKQLILESRGIASESIETGIDEFEKENYEAAAEILASGIREAEDMQSASIMQRVIAQSKLNAVDFVRENWRAVSITLLSIMVVVLLFYQQISFYVVKKQLLNSKREIVTIKGLIKKAQEDYFNMKIISKDTYDISTMKLQRREAKLKEKIGVIEERLNVYPRKS